MMNAVETTALMVAAMRAEETRRPDRLFTDSFADQLAGEAGRQALATYKAAAGFSVPIIEVRTRYYDEALARACAGGVRQLVVLAAGMDARAFRLPWPADLHFFEIDQPGMIAAKASALADAKCACQRVAIASNLAGDWSPLLTAQGFDPSARTAWLVEGLLQYLDAPTVQRIFSRIDALSAAGSVLLYDIVGQSVLDSPVLTRVLTMMRELGAPWTYGTDDPAGLLAGRGWDAVVTDPAVIGNQWQRWPFSAAPPGVPGIPRGYLVEAAKR